MTDSLQFSAEAEFDSSIATDTVETAAAVPAGPNPFEALGLAPELVQAVADLGFTQPTLVQNATIPKAMSGGHAEGFTDLMVSSQTGSGKTAAFLLPVLHTLLEQQAAAEAAERADWERQIAEAEAAGQPAPKKPKRKNPLLARHFTPAVPGALILCPTRELAQQVAQDAIELVRHCRGLRIANVVGGIPYPVQIAKLQNADLVVATPGRLLDLQRNGQIKLDKVQFLVVDEADRMLDLGFSDDLAEINQLTIQRHQTMMFSATFAPRIQTLAQRVMRAPQKVQIDSPQDKHSNIEQQLFWCDSQEHKRQLLDHWLRDATIDQAIVFASTQIECDSLAEELQQVGFSAVALHGALSQGLRTRRLMALRNGQVQILVATDVAARGIDVPTITHVFNYGLPLKAEDYTHRIGRTGRAGRKGLAVTMAEFRDRRKIGEIEAYSQQVFKTHTIAGLEPKKPVYEFNDRRPGGRGGNGRGAPRGGNFRGNDRGGDRGGWGRNDGGFAGFGGNAGRPASRGEFQPRGEFRSEPRGDVRFEPRGDARPAGRGEFRGGDRSEPRGEFRGESRGFAGREQRGPQGGFGGEQRRESFGRPQGERSFGDRPAFERRSGERHEPRGHGAPSFGDRRPRPEGGAGKPRFVKR
ncbi:DEAD/DEAH box helicase [Malikia granosa]|uniref:DEAD/DEAH box helicase n=1 Tax=Malikia granosa TaxID=263067 RepID=A0A2S9K4Z1_9BURK|nr:DEAD/DEAH box helicase [Malikia granosa]PRD65536.1 DEAD/DEAH box helicase [Malikia granosa]